MLPYIVVHLLALLSDSLGESERRASRRWRHRAARDCSVVPNLRSFAAASAARSCRFCGASRDAPAAFCKYRECEFTLQFNVIQSTFGRPRRDGGCCVRLGGSAGALTLLVMGSSTIEGDRSTGKLMIIKKQVS